MVVSTVAQAAGLVGAWASVPAPAQATAPGARPTVSTERQVKVPATAHPTMVQVMVSATMQVTVSAMVQVTVSAIVWVTGLATVRMTELAGAWTTMPAIV